MIGLWEDGRVWWEFGNGASSDKAVKSVLADLKDREHGYIGDLTIVAVIEGKHMNAVREFGFSGEAGLRLKLTPKLPPA